ncbi:S-adenosyl-L-methionine-dependent methyltransferase [Xylariomycetidae sp. FL2044]|nr:S-adenosyl-L-methionine-dependent methyltransferase [Xylariomycetidae sp. FL2044]
MTSANRGGADANGSVQALKRKIKGHYETASDYYDIVWGPHIHHGYFKSPTITNEQAQIDQIYHLLDISALPHGSRVLDVGCGLGGTARLLAKERRCTVTGITISGRQVEMARQKAAAEIGCPPSEDFLRYPDGAGAVCYREMDAEAMAGQFEPGAFDCVWISEALYHLHDKAAFFDNAFKLLAPGARSRLVVADWFRATDLSPERERRDIKPIERWMFCPHLHTVDEYVKMAEEVGLKLFQAPIDISRDVAKTWDEFWPVVVKPAVWAYIILHIKDGIGFLRGMRAIQRGYANETFRYAVISFEKP